MNRCLAIKSQLYSQQIYEKMTIEDLLRIVSNLIEQLANIGVIIPDKELVDMVLTSLPGSWDVFQQLTTQNEQPFTFAELESMLLYENNVNS
jgi:hypothetical protein